MSESVIRIASHLPTLPGMATAGTFAFSGTAPGWYLATDGRGSANLCPDRDLYCIRRRWTLPKVAAAGDSPVLTEV